MVAAILLTQASKPAIHGCPQNALEVRLIKSCDASRASFRAGRRLWRYFVTSRLRELSQQLGEAIHESVIESEQIAGVVQDIRKHGFDVLLMLEATIGLNEVTQVPKGAELTEGEADGDTMSFTPNDLSFLRSLRISVEGDDDPEKDS
jgi:hypothetical protein